MRTIPIPTSKLIKFIPSDADGGVIPGAVVECYAPEIKRISSFEFELTYLACSASENRYCTCRLDEEADIVSESNRFEPNYYERHRSRLIENGVTFELGYTDKAYWNVDVCRIPDPFDALGTHQLSNFVRCGTIQIACFSPGFRIRLAIVGNQNLISSSVIESDEPLTFGPPCQHNVGWLIPWASKSKGINVAWLEDKEMDEFIRGAGPLPKV